MRLESTLYCKGCGTKLNAKFKRKKTIFDYTTGDPRTTHWITYKCPKYKLWIFGLIKHDWYTTITFKP